jgi:1-deoxyxylulose-5-phosphate synthase
MEQIRLGSTGLKVSRLRLGCMTYGSPKWRTWVLDQERSEPFFQAAPVVGASKFGHIEDAVSALDRS